MLLVFEIKFTFPIPEVISALSWSIKKCSRNIELKEIKEKLYGISMAQMHILSFKNKKYDAVQLSHR